MPTIFSNRWRSWDNPDLANSALISLLNQHIKSTNSDLFTDRRNSAELLYNIPPEGIKFLPSHFYTEILFKFFNIPFSSLSFFYTYPNPYYSDSGSGIIFQNVPTGSIIRIFNLAGEQIREFEIHTGMQNQLLWEIRSSEIASGIYIYVIEHNGENKIGKLAIAR